MTTVAMKEPRSVAPDAALVNQQRTSNDTYVLADAQEGEQGGHLMALSQRRQQDLGREAVPSCLALVTSKLNVTAVTDVQPNKDGAPGATAGGEPNVTEVTALPKDNERPCFRIYDGYLPRSDGGRRRPGVWSFGIRSGKNDEPPTLTEQWVC